MTEPEQPKTPKTEKPKSEMTPEEIERERKLQQRIEELRKRDPFIYR